MNKKVALVGIVLLVVLIVGWFWLNKKKVNVELDRTQSENQGRQMLNNFKKEFSGRLENIKVTKIFSIPKYQAVPSFCPQCKEMGVDNIEGGNWEYVVSPDHTQFAYTILKNKKVALVFNGKEITTYDAIYFLKFSPDGKSFTYHAYDKNTDTTFLVMNNNKIPVYPGHEGYPQAANGVSEIFSPDGKRFAYAKVDKNDSTIIKIIIDGEKINEIKADSVEFRFTPDGKNLEYVGGGHYYKDSALIKSITLEEYNSFLNISIILGGKKIELTNEGDGILFDGNKVIDYSQENPNVYIKSIITNNEHSNLAYVVWNNETKREMRVSLSGNDAAEKFNDIKNIEFSSDGKTLSFIARNDRDFFEVSYDVVDEKTAK